MYELYKINEDLYQIHTSSRYEQAMEGSLLAILTYCVHRLGFYPQDLEEALLEMNRASNDGAHFGVNRTFIYSFNRKDRKKVS